MRAVSVQNRSIRMKGRVYTSPDLEPFEGRRVCAFEDQSIGGADAVCFTLGDAPEFITNAQCRELWGEMVAELAK